MDTINENGLIDLVGNRAVRKLEIVQQENGKYQVIATMARQGEPRTLVTTRGNAREWASLDNLVRHLSLKFRGALPAISLALIE